MKTNQQKICKNCGSIIPKNKKRNQLFCCIECKNEYGINTYNKNPKFCKQCGKPLPYSKRSQTFCSSTCSLISLNLNKAKDEYEKQKQTLFNTLKNKKQDPTIIKEKEQKLQNLLNSDYFSLNDYQQKKFRKHKCWVCGAIKGKCKDQMVCKKFQLFKSLTKFGLDYSLIGKEKIVYEFYRVKHLIEDHYLKWNSNEGKLKEVFGYKGSCSNFHSLLKELGIKSKTLSQANSDAYLNGNNKGSTIRNQYKQTHYLTWDNKKVFLRSSYEVDFANELDQLKIEYKVEEFRIPYFDSLKQKMRCAIPDFYLPATNEIVEIKSSWTLDIQNMKDKFKAYKEAGYIPKLILEHKEVDLYSLYLT